MNYERIGDHGSAVGLFITHGPRRENGAVLEVDHIVLCAGQHPLRDLLAAAL